MTLFSANQNAYIFRANDKPVYFLIPRTCLSYWVSTVISKTSKKNTDFSSLFKPLNLGLKPLGKVYLRYKSGFSQYESEAGLPDSNVRKSMTELDLPSICFSAVSSPMMWNCSTHLSTEGSVTTSPGGYFKI